MAVAAPPPSPILTAEALLATEAELRRLLPRAAPEVVAVALQAMDNRDLLDPTTVTALATPQDALPQVEAQRLRALAKWDEWAKEYAEAMAGLRALIEKTTSQSAPESHPAPSNGL
jgi:hypothetical protein